MISRKVEIPHDVIPASSKQCGSLREVSPGRGELIPWQHILPFNLLFVFCSLGTKSIVIQWDPEDFYLIHWIQQNSVKPSGIQICPSTLNACGSKREERKHRRYTHVQYCHSARQVQEILAYLFNLKLCVL